MNKKIKILGIAIFVLLSQEVLPGWQPVPQIGVDMNQQKTFYALIPSLSSNTAAKAYDGNKNKTGLAQLVFGDVVQIKDIFLASKLASVGDTSVNAGNYLSLVSSTALFMGGVQSCERLYFEGSMTKALGGSDVLLTIGITIPVESWEQELNIGYVGGGLGTTDIGGGATTNPQYFFKSYDSVNSFVQTEIFEPKGLLYNPFQTSTGLGSIRLFAMLDVSNYCPEWADKVQVGFVTHLNSAKTQNANVLWPIEAGFGATYLGGFGQIYLNFSSYLQPFLVFEVTGAVPQNLLMRVPMLKSPSQLAVGAGTATFGNSNVLTSQNLANTKITQMFSYYDSSIPFFADQTVLTSRHRGSFQEIKIGNVFDLNFLKIFLWYEYAHRMADKVKRSSKADALTADNEYDFTVVTRNTANTYQIVGWQGVYEAGPFTFIVGTEYTVQGKSAPQYFTTNFKLEVGF